MDLDDRHLSIADLGNIQVFIAIRYYNIENYKLSMTRVKLHFLHSQVAKKKVSQLKFSTQNIYFKSLPTKLKYSYS